jgi:hypothetical protein
MNKKAWIIILSVFLIIAGALGGTYYLYRNYIHTNTIYTGIFIEDYDVTNMTKEEALNFVKKNKVLDKVPTSYHSFQINHWKKESWFFHHKS